MNMTKAFQNPTKPIGPFYTEEEAKKIAEEKVHHERGCGQRDGSK